MHVELKHTIPPIKQMGKFELPDFAVLIGRNGVGKTQLLKAIASGSVVVSGVSPSDIEKYDIDSFQPNDSGPGGWGNSAFFHITVEKYFSKKFGPSLVKVAKNIFQETLDTFDLNNNPDGRREFEEAVRMIIRDVPDVSILGNMKGKDSVAAYVNSIRSQVIEKLMPENQNKRSTQNNRPGSFNNNQAALVCQAMKLSDKLPHELCRQDILHASHYEGNTIGNQLNQIFARYKAEQHVWAHTESETSEKSVQQLMDEYRAENCPPWETLRARLNRMREASSDPELFNFEFSDPEEDVLSYVDSHQYSFTTQFTNKTTRQQDNKTTGNSYSVKDLSSGEKIILCLCLSAFNSDMGQCQPGLLLFDELDALLHPSMISALIAGLKDQFVSNGTRVIMATHSVTTVSLLDEGEIFRVSRSGSRLDVQQVARIEAVAELSEGLATIETGLKIATFESAAPITILTEGNNVLHLKKWASLFFGSTVKVFEELQHRTGKKELASYGRLLARMETNSHFLIVWDFDARQVAEKMCKELSGSKNVTAFAFKKRENMIAPKGIENNYDEEYLQGYITTSRREKTGDKFVTMSSRDKTDFAKHVSAVGTRDYFSYFGELEKVVQKILGER